MRVAALSIALLVTLAGCGATGPGLDAPSGTTATATTSTTTVTTTTATTTSTTTATTTTPTTPTTTTREPSFAYRNLSNESQTDFQQLLDAEHVESPDPLFGPRIADQHYTRFTITYEHTTYEIRHQRQTRESKTCLLDLDPVENTSVDADDGDELFHYRNLSTDGQRLVNRVLNDSDDEPCYDPTDYPLLDHSHVRTNGTTYSLVEMHGSSYVYAYWIEPVDEDES